MANLIRKRSLDKSKRIAESSMVTNTSQSSISNVSFQQQTQNIKIIIEKFETISALQSHKVISESINNLLQSKKNILISHKLQGYKQVLILFAKYIQKLKMKAISLDQQCCVLPLSIFRSVVDDINTFTKDQSKDKVVDEADLPASLFSILEGMASAVQMQSQNTARKPILMRKNSLKKVQQLPAVRPSSRGKLSSLNKKDRLPSKKELLNVAQKQEQVSLHVKGQPTTIQQTVYKLISIVKNLSANKNCRRNLVKEQYLRVLNRYFCIWSDKNISQIGTSIMNQISAAYRHMAVDQKAFKIFLNSNCIQIWARAIEMFPLSSDLMFNLLRILSKISAYPECCDKLNQKKACLKNLSSFFKIYRSNIHIIIRVSFIFANMTSFLANIRTELYFDLNAWPDIYGCFVQYAQSQLKGKNEVQKMGISMAAWDYQAMKKESDIEAIIKIIRLIANIFTVAQIGQDIYMNDSKSFKELIIKLKGILQRKNIANHADLISCILSCLTNVLYYDKQVLLSSLEYKNVKAQIVSTIVGFIVQIQNEQICCQSLRVISNITRMKQYVKCVMDAKIHEAIMILLDSTSKQIVYYCLGTIINLLSDEQFKNEYKSDIVNAVIQILQACQNEDFELVTVGLKVLGTIMNDNSAVEAKQLTQIEDCLMSLGSHCDRIILDNQDKNQVNSAHESRGLINVLLNNMPEQKFICPVKNCGRKFADQLKLNDHVSRRHKTS